MEILVINTPINIQEFETNSFFRFKTFKPSKNHSSARHHNMSDGKKPVDVPNIDQLKQMAATAGRKSTVASTPKDPQQETFMGKSIGAKPLDPPAPGGDASMVNVAAPRRRRERAARAPLDIDPAELAKFNMPAAAPPPEKSTSVSGLMAPSPEPEEEVKKPASPPKIEEEVKKSPSPKPAEEVKPPSPIKSPEEKPPSPAKQTLESPESAEKPEPPKSATPSPKPIQTLSPKESPKPAVAAAAMAPEKIPTPPAAAPTEMSAENQKKLADLEIYEKICQKLVPGKAPSPMVLIGYIEPMKQQLPSLQDQAQKLQTQLGDLSETLKKKDAQIADLQAKVMDAEKKAASAISEGTSKALDNVVINDEDVNKLRGAFEEHMKNYQSSLDQFQEFFDKITADLDSTFKELGIDEKDIAKPEDKS
jgi:hypothetical protein